MTGWLQIQAVRPSDEGIYRCLARNALGQVEAPASLTVLTPGKGEPWAPGTGGTGGGFRTSHVRARACVRAYGCTCKYGFLTVWDTWVPTAPLSCSLSFAHMCLQTS